MRNMRVRRIFVVGLVVCICSCTMLLWIYSRISYLQTTAPINVLLLTYSRSGSSLLGELLSSTGNASYFFEPLFYPCQQLKRCHVNHRYVDQLLRCDGDTLYDLIYRSMLKIVRKMHSITYFDGSSYYNPEMLSHHCQMDKIHVVKTIRLRVREVVKLVQSGSVPNLRVVHLFRDPRARYHSLQSGGNWDFSFRSMDTVCEEMETDLKHSRRLPQNMYTRIRYEDVVDDPVGRVQWLFARLYDRGLSEETISYIETHMLKKLPNNKINKRKKSNRGYYYVTYRNSSFDPNKWRKVMDLTSVKLVEQKCNNVMKELGYQIFHTT